MMENDMLGQGLMEGVMDVGSGGGKKGEAEL